MISGDIASDQIDTSLNSVLCVQGGQFRLFGSPNYHHSRVSSGASLPDQDIIVDLRDDYVITAIATQGTYNANDHTRIFPTYYVFQYRTSGSGEWKPYVNIDGSSKV